MYNIISHEYKDQLIKLVNEAMKDGWVPVGNVAICKLNVYHQTMTKKGKKDEQK